MPRDIERRRATARAYLRNHPEYAETARARAREYLDKKRMADPLLRRKVEIYQQLIELQGGEHCAICKVPRKSNEKRLAIDHDWETDEIRGLLCTRCNKAMGRTREVALWLHNAIAYLERETYTGISFEEVRRVTQVEYRHMSNKPRIKRAA